MKEGDGMGWVRGRGMRDGKAPAITESGRDDDDDGWWKGKVSITV